MRALFGVSMLDIFYKTSGQFPVKCVGNKSQNVDPIPRVVFVP